MKIAEMEEKYDLIQNKQIRKVYDEINDVFDKNLDNILDEFIEGYDLAGSEIESYLRKLIKYIKESNNIK